jgi:hypothetical protein
MRRLPLLLVAAAAFVASGCITHHHHGGWEGPGHGPPPWAPAHGYRHKHHQDGVQLVFDSGLGVYVVVGQPYHWFHHDHYYWLRDGEWHRSQHIGGPWVVTAVDAVPPGLRRKHARGGDGHGKHGGHGKGKGGPHGKHDD